MLETLISEDRLLSNIKSIADDKGFIKTSIDSFWSD